MRTKVYVLSVRNGPKGPEIIVSRSHKDMLKRLFEIEVPEVHNGVVEIKAIARESGFRSKVAVHATQQGIDPVGSCIGIRGNRIQSIVNELQGEKIDVVSWDRDPKVFISHSLSPSEPVHVELSADDQTATVVVPDRQLSLAIGKEGQNTRLAGRLTGWRLDIKGLTEWEEFRERRLKEIQERVALEARPDIAEEAILDVVAEAEAVVAESLALETETGAEVGELVEEASEAEPVVAEVAYPVTEEFDEDKILEALIQEEGAVEQGAATTVDQAGAGFSVEDLEALTITDIGVTDVQFDDGDAEQDEGEPDLELLPSVAVLTPDAGKIRFAEDIVDESRSGGRRDRKARRTSGPSRGARRGGR
jgi:N utilization substance protein A